MRLASESYKEQAMKIEKNIPIPFITNSSNDKFVILDEMIVGDSVLFEKKDWKKARNKAYIRKPKLFTFRHVPNGYRCWRIQ